MIFNSLEFVVFFIAFFLLYWLVFNRNLRNQNLLLLAGSYFFYAWWDWRFLLLLVGSSCITFLLGIAIDKTGNEKQRKLLVTLGLVLAIGSLAFFKYYNF